MLWIKHLHTWAEAKVWFLYHIELSYSSARTMSKFWTMVENHTIDRTFTLLTPNNRPRIPSEKRNQESRRLKTNRGKLCFRTPLVFFDKLWTFDIFQSFSTWNFTLQVNNVLPLDSEIFILCEEGKVEEIQKLFTARLASPFDCNCYGEGLLHVGPKSPFTLTFCPCDQNY